MSPRRIKGTKVKKSKKREKDLSLFIPWMHKKIAAMSLYCSLTNGFTADFELSDNK